MISRNHAHFSTFSRITHASRFTQSRRNKIVFTISRNKKRRFTQSRNPMGGLFLDLVCGYGLQFLVSIQSLTQQWGFPSTLGFRFLAHIYYDSWFLVAVFGYCSILDSERSIFECGSPDIWRSSRPCNDL